jgi:hypothetical protein
MLLERPLWTRSLTRMLRWYFHIHIFMLSSPYELDRHIVYHWVGQTHCHAIIILRSWVEKTHRQWFVMLSSLRSWVGQTVSSTDTSTCYPHQHAIFNFIPRSTFQGSEYSIWATNHWKVYRKSGFHLLFHLPKSSFGEHKLVTLKLSSTCTSPFKQGWHGSPMNRHTDHEMSTKTPAYHDWLARTLFNTTGAVEFYAPQTKILDGWTKRCVCVFEVLFKGESTSFGLPLIENSFKNAYATLCSFDPENPSFGEHKIYPSQTKILEGRTNRPERLFDALFKGVSTQLGLRNVEKCVEKTFRTVCSAFQNLRLGSIKFGMGMKNVDKNIDKRNKQWFGSEHAS